MTNWLRQRGTVEVGHYVLTTLEAAELLKTGAGAPVTAHSKSPLIQRARNTLIANSLLYRSGDFLYATKRARELVKTAPARWLTDEAPVERQHRRPVERAHV